MKTMNINWREIDGVLQCAVNTDDQELITALIDCFTSRIFFLLNHKENEDNEH